MLPYFFVHYKCYGGSAVGPTIRRSVGGKPQLVDGTIVVTLWESRSLPDFLFLGTTFRYFCGE